MDDDADHAAVVGQAGGPDGELAGVGAGLGVGTRADEDVCPQSDPQSAAGILGGRALGNLGAVQACSQRGWTVPTATSKCVTVSSSGAGHQPRGSACE